MAFVESCDVDRVEALRERDLAALPEVPAGVMLALS
jgi:hypothetical protein